MDSYNRLQTAIEKLIALGYSAEEGTGLNPPEDRTGNSSQPAFFTAMPAVRRAEVSSPSDRANITIEATYYVSQFNCNEKQGRDWLDKRVGGVLCGLCKDAGLSQGGKYEDDHNPGSKIYPEVMEGHFAVDTADHRGGKSNVINLYKVAVNPQQLPMLVATAEKLVTTLEKAKPAVSPKEQPAAEKYATRNIGTSFALRE